MTPPDDGREASGTGEDAALTVGLAADDVKARIRIAGRRGPGDVRCCILCGKTRLGLPDEHGCRPNLSESDWEQLRRADAAPARNDLFAPKPRPTVARAPGRLVPRRVVVARFDGLVHNLRGAAVGERNPRLHWVACRVGEMLAAGELPDAGLAADALATVALEIGLDPREVVGTIKSGFGASGVIA